MEKYSLSKGHDIVSMKNIDESEIRNETADAVHVNWENINIKNIHNKSKLSR